MQKFTCAIPCGVFAKTIKMEAGAAAILLGDSDDEVSHSCGVLHRRGGGGAHQPPSFDESESSSSDSDGILEEDAGSGTDSSDGDTSDRATSPCENSRLNLSNRRGSRRGRSAARTSAQRRSTARGRAATTAARGSARVQAARSRRGRGRNSGTSSARARSTDQHKDVCGWSDADTAPSPCLFSPIRDSGAQFPEDFTPSNEASFFCLFFTHSLMAALANFTNAYAWCRIPEKPNYADKDGAWIPTTADEMYRLVALIIYMSVFRLPRTLDYWRTSTLFHGNWARKIIPTYLRYKSLMAFLHVSSIKENSGNTDKLKKVRFVYDHMREVCSNLFQPYQHISVDERMIRQKGRTSLRQYMPKKPTKWGVKVFAICDVQTSYCLDFEIYTGHVPGQDETGMTRAVVNNLIAAYEHQGYIVYTDNFYTSPALAKDLNGKDTQLVGTLRSNRQGVPEAMKSVKAFEKSSSRGDMRYSRSGRILIQQWRDSKVVCMLSTVHSATESVDVTRNVKAGGQHTVQTIKQPIAISHYNHGMGGVDIFRIRTGPGNLEKAWNSLKSVPGLEKSFT